MSGSAHREPLQERWTARKMSPQHLLAVMGVGLLIVVATCVGVVKQLSGGAEPDEYQIYGLIAQHGSFVLFGLAMVAYAWWAMTRLAVVSIDGSWLLFTTGRTTKRARLSPGAIVAGRRASGAGQFSYGSELVVQLEDGKMVTLHVPAQLPDDRYQTDSLVEADWSIEPGEGARRLITRLLPFVMTRPLPEGVSTAPAATHTIPLKRHGAWESSPAEMYLYLSGDGLALGSAGSATLLTQARMADVSVVPFSYYHYTELVDRTYIDCPGISLRFPSGHDLRIGASVVSGKDWWGRAVRRLHKDLVEYATGEPELRKLAEAFGLVPR